MREKSQFVPLGAMVGSVGNVGFGFDPTATGENQYFCVPTGQCVIRNRGGGAAPCALASIVRSSVLRPTAPAPMLRMKARRAMRYELIGHLRRRAQQGFVTAPLP